MGLKFLALRHWTIPDGTPKGRKVVPGTEVPEALLWKDLKAYVEQHWVEIHIDNELVDRALAPLVATQLQEKAAAQLAAKVPAKDLKVSEKLKKAPAKKKAKAKKPVAPKPDIDADAGEFPCPHGDFVAKSAFGLRAHLRAKHKDV